MADDASVATVQAAPARRDAVIVPSPTAVMPGWEAHLALAFARRGERTVLVRRGHRGPLVVQKPLHPEGPGVCQAVVVHPPGGIAGGDRLALDVEVGAGAHAQLVTPGAAKWYRSSGAPAHQRIDARVADGAMLEWLPHEAIVFDGAIATLHSRVDLAGSAAFVGFDIVCLGRTASGERFSRGAYRQCVEVVHDDALIWTERTRIDAGDALSSSRVGLNGSPMFGTFVAAGPVVDDDLLTACRRVAVPERGGLEGALTRLPGVLVARCRGTSPEVARRWFTELWRVLRPAWCARAAMPPRIWNT